MEKGKKLQQRFRACEGGNVQGKEAGLPPAPPPHSYLEECVIGACSLQALTECEQFHHLPFFPLLFSPKQFCIFLKSPFIIRIKCPCHLTAWTGVSSRGCISACYRDSCFLPHPSICTGGGLSSPLSPLTSRGAMQSSSGISHARKEPVEA